MGYGLRRRKNGVEAFHRSRRFSEGWFVARSSVKAGRELDTDSGSFRIQAPMQVSTESITLSAAVEEIERRMILAKK
jgi:hypothetical protein